MGWLIFPDLGDEKVICQNPCEHLDCKAWRETNTTCPDCGKEIKAGDKVYFEKVYFEAGRWVHAPCMWGRESEP